MLYDTDEFGSDRGINRQTLLVILVVAKLLRTASLYTSYGYLRLLNYPSTVWAWFLLFGASIIFLILQQPWKGRFIQPQLWIEIGIHGFIQAIQLICFFIGLKYFGPVRTMLFADFAEITYVFIAGLFFSKTRDKMHLNRKRGILLLVIGYAILFFFDNTPIPEGIPRYASTEFSLGSLSISASKAGAIFLVISTWLIILQKKMGKTLGHNIGSGKRLNSLSTIAATIILSPFAAYSWYDAENVLSAGHWFHFFEAVGFSIAVLLVINYYVDTMIKPQIRSQQSMQFSLGSAFLICYILEAWSGEITLSFFTFIAFAVICFGQFLIFKTPEPGYGRSLSALDRPESSESITDSLMPLINQLSQRIKSNKDARNIFIYLCLNLLFMFVEMLYGIWNNSLGLISDGFHMLFDCIALIIGLVALVISEWHSNRTYTYGYTRVNILSGFINAVFLVFIACSVFYEAIHRFVEPPHIENDNLLLVSTLGLVVNLVGLFVFSQAHHAAHGHSHSHGSSNSHDDEESGHGHSHGHSHSHGSSDDDHEDENMKGVFLHILGDTLGSVGVIISSLCIEYFSWTIADPICSIIIACFIFTSVIPLLKSSATILLQVTPKRATKKLPGCLHQITSIYGVQGYTEPHFWSTDGNEVIGTIHIQISSDANSQEILNNAKSIFARESINQVTIQIEQTNEGVESLISSQASY